MKKYSKYFKILVPLLALLVIACLFIYSKSITTDILLNGEEKIVLEYGESYQELGATAHYASMFTKNKEAKVKVEGSVDEKKVGSYIVEYSVSKFFKSSSVKRTVEIVDTTPPDIKLNISSDYYCKIGEDYQEEGFIATDNYDGDLTKNVVSTIENGVVTYSVKDSSGNEFTTKRTIRYDLPPAITLVGGSNVTVYVGDPYKEPGYNAKDDRDGDVTNQMKVIGEVDTSKEGTYRIIYQATDQYGNMQEAVRTVTVAKKPVQTGNPTPNGNKIVYLTFDDGPGPYTQRLLDICAKYNVKVTFFVTNQFPNYQNMIAKEAAAGHTVAIHTYSHDYAIYRSTQAYYDDLYKMQQVIQNQTGIKTNLLRFPGGGSNAISKGYCPGIMTTLTQSVQQNGFVYFDWNVSSGDAGGTTSAAGVAQNVINGISKTNVSVVLQHDIKAYSVEATEQIIIWGLQNGYTFLPLTASSYAPHHRVNN